MCCGVRGHQAIRKATPAIMLMMARLFTLVTGVYARSGRTPVRSDNRSAELEML